MLAHLKSTLYLWRKFCQVEKSQISVKNLNNLWRFIEIYAVFVLNCMEKNLCGENMTNIRSAPQAIFCLDPPQTILCDSSNTLLSVSTSVLPRLQRKGFECLI